MTTLQKIKSSVDLFQTIFLYLRSVLINILVELEVLHFENTDLDSQWIVQVQKEIVEGILKVSNISDLRNNIGDV